MAVKMTDILLADEFSTIRLLNEDVNYYRSVVLQKRTASDDEPAPQPESAD